MLIPPNRLDSRLRGNDTRLHIRKWHSKARNDLKEALNKSEVPKFRWLILTRNTPLSYFVLYYFISHMRKQSVSTVTIVEKQIKGISVRTTNRNELNPTSARIGSLYQRFDAEVPVDYKSGARVYGVYYDYESDASGEYSVLAGSDQIDESVESRLEQVTIARGSYVVFNAKGEVPKAIIDTWIKIWDYFKDKDAPYQRAYTTDFEFYISQNEIDIYIAVK